MLLRIIVVFLPGFLLAAGAGLLIASPLAWGVGVHAGLRAWHPPLVGVAFALPAIIVGWKTLRAVGRKTRDRVLVHALPLAFGALFLFGGSLVVWGLVGSVPDPATYDALLTAPAVSPEGPRGFAAAQRNVQFQEDLSEAGFVAIALLLSAFMFAWVSAASYAYATAFQADPLMKFEASPKHEVDVVGMLLRGERGTHG